MQGGSFFSSRPRCALAGVAAAFVFQAFLLGLLSGSAPSRGSFFANTASASDSFGDSNVHKNDRTPPPALAPSTIPPIVKVLRRTTTSRHAKAVAVAHAPTTLEPLQRRRDLHVTAAVAVANAADLKRLCRRLL